MFTLTFLQVPDKRHGQVDSTRLLISPFTVLDRVRPPQAYAAQLARQASNADHNRAS